MAINLHDLDVPESEALLEERFRLISEEGEASFETAHFRENGTTFSLSVLAKRIQWIERPAVLSIAKDITEQKRAEKFLNNTLERLRGVTGSVIQVIVAAVEFRDPYTAGHQKRVSDLGRAIATEMKLPDDHVEGIRIAGVIHDLGKISVPAEILSKPSKLNEMEFNLVKDHPLNGYGILKDVDFDWPIAEIVYQHHERLDGSGYPRGLKGEEILLEARILAVADVVEAMASHRPYRAALGLDAALEEITANRGSSTVPELSMPVSGSSAKETTRLLICKIHCTVRKRGRW